MKGLFLLFIAVSKEGSFAKGFRGGQQAGGTYETAPPRN